MCWARYGNMPNATTTLDATLVGSNRKVPVIMYLMTLIYDKPRPLREKASNMHFRLAASPPNFAQAICKGACLGWFAPAGNP